MEIVIGKSHTILPILFRLCLFCCFSRGFFSSSMHTWDGTAAFGLSLYYFSFIVLLLFGSFISFSSNPILWKPYFMKRKQCYTIEKEKAGVFLIRESASWIFSYTTEPGVESIFILILLSIRKTVPPRFWTRFIKGIIYCLQENCLLSRIIRGLKSVQRKRESISLSLGKPRSALRGVD